MNFSSPQTRRNNPKAIRRIANAAPNCRLWRGSNDAVAVWLIGISPSFLTLPVPVSLHRGVNAQFDNRAAWIIGGELHIPCDRALNRHQRSSEERRVGKECVSTCRSRCSQDHK